MIPHIFAYLTIIKKWLVALLLLLPFSLVSAASPGMARTEIERLNTAIRMSSTYRSLKIRHIDSLQQAVNRFKSPREKFEGYLKVADAYRTFMADSSLHYTMLADREARLSGDVSLLHRADIAMVGSMSVAGLFTEASQRLDSLKSLSLPIDEKLEMWMSARMLFSSMMTYVGETTPLVKIYRTRYLAIDDSLLQHLPPTSVDYKFIYSERLVSTGQFLEAETILNQILSSQPESANIYGKAAYQLAIVYLRQGDEEKYTAYLAMAAISDITGCVTEGWALPMLANWLYQNGKLDQAFTYINFALSEAMAGNARMRTAVIAGMIPAIDEAYRKSLTSSRDQLVIYLCIITFLFLCTTALIIILWRQIHRLHEVKRKLTETSRLQEFYLGNFVGLCSSYSSKLRSWQKMVTRKLASGQTDDLLKTLKTGKISDENEDFHSVIDKAFLELYPDFINEINTLLRPEEHIRLSKPGVLTPELRIYALIRLGVEESSRIAAILQYSSNTVYTYRNKMRNKSVDRASFEKQVRGFSSH